MLRSASHWARRIAGSLRVRLLLVNVVVLLVPVAGIEFARIHERQLLHALERDMRDQAVLAREIAEGALARGSGLDDADLLRVLVRAASRTRTRVRILDAEGALVLDSHAHGPPEGPEPPAPTVLPRQIYELSAEVRSVARDRRRGSSPEWLSEGPPPEQWPAVPDRREVREALEGHPASFTRIREESPSVILFVTEPIRGSGDVAGAVYVTRSTQPVLEQLYVIRRGLVRVLLVAFGITLAVTLVLGLSITQPLARLARAARRISSGDRDVRVPVVGTGEIRDVSTAFAAMQSRLDERARYIEGFAADVAHEFKSPLTSIRGAAELLSEGAADDARARERFLRNILLDSERLERLVARLLELSRIDASREPMARVELEEIAGRVIERTHTSEQPVVLSLRERVAIRGRAADLERALLNLVENALRFSPAGARIDVEVSSERGHALIRVVDHGPGVPQEHRPRLFERFFTTDAERSGTGLGLAIVKSVAEAHAGRVSLEDTPGGGATFVLDLGPRIP